MNKQKVVHFLLFCSMTLVLTGCWDRVEIEQRGFVVGMAVDLAEESSGEETKLTVTNQFVIPSGLGTPAKGGGGKAYFNLSASGKSLFEIESEMATLTSRSPFFQHLQIIVVSSKLASSPNVFSNAMDLFIRNYDMRRGVNVLISDGKAKKVLDAEPDSEKLPVMYVQSIMENSFKKADVIKPLRIGQVHQYLLNQSSYVIPRVSINENRLDYEGLSVFHGYNNRMIGTLNSEETKGYNLIEGNTKGGTIKVQLEDQPVVVEIMDATSTTEIRDKAKENISASVNIEVEGMITENFSSNSLKAKGHLKEIEEKAGKKVEKVVNKTIKKAQEELQADIFGIGEIYRKEHYELWTKIKDDWDHGKNYFAQSDIKVSAEVKIQSTGATDQTK